MRVAALYDVHGNLPALEAVLGDVRAVGADVIVSGGDILWGPFPAECLALMQFHDARFIKGNTERLVLSRADSEHAWAFERVTEEQRAAVDAWPATLAMDVEGLGRVLFCHGSPRSDEEVLTAATPDAVAAEALADAGADIVVCGHTHHQFDRVVAGTRLVNAGSVGFPYEGRAGAYWALLGPNVDLRRTAYDVLAAAERMRQVGPPQLDEYLDATLLAPIPREEAVAQFERMAGRGT